VLSPSGFRLVRRSKPWQLDCRSCAISHPVSLLRMSFCMTLSNWIAGSDHEVFEVTFVRHLSFPSGQLSFACFVYTKLVVILIIWSTWDLKSVLIFRVVHVENPQLNYGSKHLTRRNHMRNDKELPQGISLFYSLQGNEKKSHRTNSRVPKKK
jgi:hypothetical protein